mmetsp:Transcript_18236/g.46315  ORF Transcript_18236/g.46315 Transcript_18236/m.46315 type:complete len:494 (+) Transcript_18236:98-1579(+)
MPRLLTVLCLALLASAAMCQEPELVEGDIVNDDYVASLRRGDPTIFGAPTKGRVWGTVVPYVWATDIDPEAKRQLTDAMNHHMSKHCVVFKPRTTEEDYVHFQNANGCWSYVGRVGGRQEIGLSPQCGFGAAVHELMHCLGFFHEQSRPDRDQYVVINWGNIQDGKADQFNKYDTNQVDIVGSRYDYTSIMHYDRTAFSKNGGDTITAKQAGVQFGQRNGLSTEDVRLLRKMYGCGDGGSVSPSPSPAAQPTKYATLHQDCGYGGAYYKLVLGDAASQAWNVGAGEVSSIRIKGDITCWLYSEANMKGDVLQVAADVSCLNSAWNDHVQSIVCKQGKPPAASPSPSPSPSPVSGNTKKVQFYTDCNYAGTSVVLEVPEGATGEVYANIPSTIDNQISSIRLDQGLSCVVYTDPNRQGSQGRLDASISCISGTFGDSISSVSCRISGGAPPPPTACADAPSYATSCPSWTQSGFCTGQYEEFMARNCAKSCNKC